MRISGSLLLRETYRPPWSVALPDSRALAAFLEEPASAHVAAFHLVESGQCILVTSAGEEIPLLAGGPNIRRSGRSHQLQQWAGELGRRIGAAASAHFAVRMVVQGNWRQRD
jgi:hypothetical protein